MNNVVQDVQCSKLLIQHAADTSGCMFVLSLFLLCWSPLVLAACMVSCHVQCIPCRQTALLTDCNNRRFSSSDITKKHVMPCHVSCVAAACHHTASVVKFSGGLLTCQYIMKTVCLDFCCRSFIKFTRCSLSHPAAAPMPAHMAVWQWVCCMCYLAVQRGRVQFANTKLLATYYKGS